MHMYPVKECACTYMHVCLYKCTHFITVWKEILVFTSLGLWRGIREFSVRGVFMVTEHDRSGKGPGHARVTCARRLHLQSVCCTRTDIRVMPDTLLGDEYEISFFFY